MYSQFPSKVFRFSILIVALVILFGVTDGGIGAQESAPLEEALEAAETAGSYQFSAEINQTLIPRPDPLMIGKGEEQAGWLLNGELAGVEQAVLQLSLAGDVSGRSAVTIIRNGADTFVQSAAGIEKSSNPLSQVTPTTDFLSYLEAAENIEKIGSEVIGGETFTHYRYTLSGPQFANQLAAQLQEQAGDDLPAGMRLTVPDTYQRLTGEGELWVDGAGLPRRQQISLTMPQVSPFYDSDMEITVNFQNYGGDFAVPQVRPDGEGGWTVDTNWTGAVVEETADFSAGRPAALSSAVTVISAAAAEAVPDMAVSVLILLVILLVAHLYRRRPFRVYAGIVIPLILMMTATPLLSSLPYERFQTRQVEAAEAGDPVMDALGIQAESPEARNPLQEKPDKSSLTALNSGRGDAFVPGRQLEGRDVIPGTCGTDSADPLDPDEDGDGLDTVSENCLGTNPYSYDTDFDLITDTLEVNGFTFGGQLWTTDPTKADSNGDGLADGLEWVAPYGSAPEWDMDGDQIPNVWDEDNDGDGVVDALDLSPFYVAEERDVSSFNLSGNFDDDYLYIEFQLVPSDTNHLRYSTTPLDWPADSLGQIQDLDDSPADINLVPYLEVASGNKPNDEMVRRYGLAVVPNGDDYLIYIPLLGQGDGRISNFYGKIVYDPGDFGGINWEYARLAWNVIVANDLCTETSCGQPRLTPIQTYYEAHKLTGFRVTRSGETEVALFGTAEAPTEDKTMFQFMMGMNESYMNYEQMENQAPGRTALQEIMVRFTNPAAPYAFTWGIEAPLTMLDQSNIYQHQDEMLAELGLDTQTFLDQNYTPDKYGELCRDTDGNEFRCASIATAMQNQAGALDVTEMTFLPNRIVQVPVPGQAQAVNKLANGIFMSAEDVVVLTSRSVNLNMHENVNGQWQLTSPARMMEIVENRYAGQWETMAADMQAVYPVMNKYFIYMSTYMSYLAFYAGQQRVIKYGDLLQVNEVSDDTGLNIGGGLAGSNFEDAPSYITEANGLADAITVLESSSTVLSKSIKLAGSIPASVSYTQADIHKASTVFIKLGLNKITRLEAAPTIGRVTFNLFVILAAAITSAVGIGIATANLVCGGLAADNASVQCDEEALEWVNISNQIAQGIGSGIAVIASAVNLGIKIATEFSKLSVALGVVAIVVAVIAFVIQLAVIWISFGLLVAGTNSSMAVDAGLSSAFAQTIVATIFFILTIATIVLLMVFPVVGVILGLVLAIFFLLDAIVGFITYMTLGETYNFTTFLTNAIASVLAQTTLLTEPKEIDFEGIQTSFGALPDFMEPGGAVVGNTFLLSDIFEGTIRTTRFQVDSGDFGNVSPRDIDGDRDDLEDSGVLAWYISEENPTIDGSVVAVATEKNDVPDPGDANPSDDGDCEVNDQGGLLTCTNEVGVEFLLKSARRNIPMTITTKIEYDLIYELCVFSFFGECVHKENKTENVDLPTDDLEDDFTLVMYLDVFPATVDDFFNWSEIDNPDSDGDGLTDSQENQLFLNPQNWDTDGDGLSDYFEFNNHANLGTNPYKADSDGDGLTDDYELRIHTAVNEADTDGDGLLDSEEVYHMNEDGQWAGGWDAFIPGLGQVRVYSDPLIADADADLLDDVQEREIGASPNAYNSAPGLIVNAYPRQVAPDGRRGIFVEPGDTVTTSLLLLSVGPQPVTTTLSTCLPNGLINIQGGVMGTDRTPPAVIGGCNGGGTGYNWTFNQAPGNPFLNYTLQIGEVVSTGLLSQVDPGLTNSLTGTIGYDLPYADDVLSGGVKVYIDADNPTAAISAPEDGAFLRGTSYVVGGSAADPTSWVERVMVDVDDGGGFVEAAGTGPWAYTWNLPSDGVYTLQAQSFDYFDNPSPIDSVSVTVDNTPPTVTTTLNEEDYITTVGGPVLITGDANDNLSGVARVQISIDGRPFQEVSLSDNGTNPTWSYDWILGFTAQGSHTIKLRAFDRAGNMSGTIEREVTVDIVPPSDDLTSRLSDNNIPVFSANPSATFNGYANDAGNVPQQPRPAALQGTLDAVNDATVWLSPDTAADDDGGTTLTWLGDVNADGRGDMAVGMPAAAGGAGRVTIVYGRYGDWTLPNHTELLADSHSSFIGTPGAGLGSQVAAAGDVNGDSVSDFLIGDPANNMAYLVYGRPQVYGTDQLLGDTIRGTKYAFTAPAGYGLGSWVASAGDVDGDGQADFVLGGTNESLLIVGDDLTWNQTVDASFVAAARFATSGGSRLFGVGDVNNDQLDDWVITDPANSYGSGVGLYLMTAAPDVVPGAGLLLDPAASNIHFFPSAGFGESQVAALGDVDGDTLPDFLYSSGNAPRLVYGRETGPWNYDVEFSAYTPAPDAFLAAPGDVNADGLNDIILGSSTNSAYLIHGDATRPAVPDIAAVIEGVVGAASTPFASGADLNCDFSSDMLLLPEEAGIVIPDLVDFGEGFHYSVGRLPAGQSGFGTAVEQANQNGFLAAAHYVDDDLVCGGSSPCYATVQEAVDAAVSGDTITLYPGVYAPFTAGAGKDYLDINGVNPDAVFVDGQGGPAAVTIQDAAGVHLSEMTLRNANSAVLLINAGVGGETTAGDMIQIDHILAYDFTHAVSMDRVSTADIDQATFAGSNSTAEFIHITGPGDPAYTPAWQNRANAPASVGLGGELMTEPGSNLIWAFNNDNSPVLRRYDITANSWNSTVAGPGLLHDGISLPLMDDGDVKVLRGNRLGDALSTGSTNNLLAYWKFNETFTLGPTDSSGNGRTLFGSATDVTDSAPTEYNNPRSYDFNGTTNDYGLAAGSPAVDLASRPFTVSFWAKRDSTGTADYAVALGTNSDNQGLHVGFRDDNTFTCGFWANDLDTSSVYTDTDWHHWACVYSGFARYIYRDGVQVASDFDFTNPFAFTGSGNFRVGSRFDDSGFFDGKLDEVRIHDRALNDEEIGSLITAKITAMAKHNEALYVGGLFSAIDGVSAANLARWDGGQWLAMGQGTDGMVNDIAVDNNGVVYVGGEFNHVYTAGGGEIDADGFAVWQNGQWKTNVPDIGSVSAVNDIEIDPSTATIYVGGDFTESGYSSTSTQGYDMPDFCIPGDYEVTIFEHEYFGHEDDPDGSSDYDSWCQRMGPGDGDPGSGDHDMVVADDNQSILVGSLVQARVYDDDGQTGCSRLYSSSDLHMGGDSWTTGSNCDSSVGDGVASVRITVKPTKTNIASYNLGTNSWSNLDGGVGGRFGLVSTSGSEVHSMEWANNKLYVGGNFEIASGLNLLMIYAGNPEDLDRIDNDREYITQDLAVWDGSGWDQAIEDYQGTNGAIFTVDTIQFGPSEPAPIFGGSFTRIYYNDGDLRPSFVSNRIGAEASSGGLNMNIGATGFNDTVYDLVVNPATQQVIAGGAFTNYAHISIWNGGGSWSTFKGTGDTVHDLLFVSSSSPDLNQDDLYAGGVFNTAGPNNAPVLNMVRFAGSQEFNGVTWTGWTLSDDQALYELNGSTQTVNNNGNNNYFVYLEDGEYKLYRYHLNNDTWTARAGYDPSGFTPRLGGNSTIAWASGRLYLLEGGTAGQAKRLFSYHNGSDTWTQLANPGFNAVLPGMAWDGGDYLYVTANGSFQTLFYRYSISNDSWEDITGLAAGVPTVGNGTGLVRNGDHLYLTIGGGSNAFRSFGEINQSPTKLTLANSAVVAPDTAASAAWFALEDTSGWTGDFNYQADTNQLVGGSSTTWTPAPSGSVETETVSSADFYDAAANVYRIGENSSLTTGYYSYVPPQTVSAVSCDGCLSTIQEAIDTGTQQIYVEPGVYPDPFYMVSGVGVFGSGADLTILQPAAPFLAGNAMVTAEGIRGATLAKVTIAGNGSDDGILVEDGAQAVKITRNIIRGTDSAVVLDGVDTIVEFFNNTLFGNGNGVLAQNGAGIDVRNTLFVNHSGSALAYQSSAPTLLHRYNGYFGNAADFTIDGSPVSEPGTGEIFADPQFVNVLTNDFRLQPFSPMIDAGNPSDAVPPGAGGRIDIGYVETSLAAFFADDDYCASCLNDGLIWQVEAFDSIQDAVDAAAAQLDLLGVPDQGRYTIGVGPGTYNENVALASHMRLVCSGPDNSVIDGGGSGPAVLLDSVVQSSVSQCHITNGSGAGIHITNHSNNNRIFRTVMTNNDTAVLVDGGSSARVLFSTLTNNGGGIHSSGGRSWVDAQNNIITDGAFGLQSDGGAKLLSDYNLLHNSTDAYLLVTPGDNDLEADPLFVNAGAGNYQLTAASPAVDSANPDIADVPPGGGVVADRGSYELQATPLALFFGTEGESCAVGNSGVEAVEMSYVSVSSVNEPLTATLPTAWQTVTLATPGETASYWSGDVAPAQDGLYRLFTRASDVAGNQETNLYDWFNGHFYVDNTFPDLAWITPTGTISTDQAAVYVQAATTAEDGSIPYFMVDGGQAVPGIWTDAYKTDFYAWIPLSAGSYDITAHLQDKAGNEAVTDARTVTVNSPDHVATITSVLNNGAVSSGNLSLSGYVRFTNTADTGYVTVQVDGGAVYTATVEDDGALLTTWTADVVLSGAGAHTLTTDAGRNSLQALSSGRQVRGISDEITVILDTQAPAIAIDTPADGAEVGLTTTFSGTVSDDSGLIAAVEVSFDGGTTWQTAAINGGSWSLSHTFAGLNAYSSYPVWARVTDAAGNETMVTQSVVVDTEAPDGITPVTFSIPEGSHLDAYEEITAFWQPAVDTGTGTTITVGFDQSPTAMPATAASGGSYTVTLSGAGDWYAHIKATDAAGNFALYDYGPWHVGSFSDPGVACNARTQSIFLNGFLDFSGGEWTAGEFLDDDLRSGNSHSLYATWSGSAFYLGWQGGWWNVDGVMWAYLDYTAGGSTQPVGPGQLLPFAADAAFEIVDETTGRLWTYNGDWQSEPLDFAISGSGGTEISLPWDIDQVSTARLLAFAVEDGRQTPSALFPTTNKLTGSWTDAYEWSGICNIAAPNDSQPSAPSVALSLDSPQSLAAGLGPNGTIDYAVTLDNLEVLTLTNVTVALTPTAGLSYQSVSGANCTNCAGSVWQVEMPTLTGSSNATFTLTAQLDSDLTGLTAVTTTAQVENSNLDGAGLSHAVDGVKPAVTIDTQPGLPIGTGSQSVSGAALDNETGVALVEVLPEGGSWQPASGTLVWTADMNVSGSTFTVQARATDLAGNVSDPVSVTFNVDTTPPVIDFALPAVITGTIEPITGTAFDPAPAGSLLGGVAVQINDPAAVWQSATNIGPLLGGQQSWTYQWALPVADGVPYQLRTRAADTAGNMTVSGWQTATVDTIAPVITTTTMLTSVILSDYQVGGGGPPVLAGTVSDGSGVNNVTARVYAPDGTVYFEAVTLVGSNWEYVPVYAPEGPVGRYAVSIEARDIYGNVRAESYHLEVEDQDILGLTATNDSPTALGQPTTLTATVTAGTNVTYSWDFGDGTQVERFSENGRDTQTHIYPAIGVYTATVTAANSAGQATATMTVIIEEMITGLTVSNDGPTVLDSPTTFDAALATGSDVSYTWNFGDGSPPVSSGASTTISHTYGTDGQFTAVVTATNQVSEQSATTLVFVDVEVSQLAVVNDGPTIFGSATVLTATADIGTNVTYTWNFGDGSTPLTAFSPGGSSDTQTHEYTEPGIYTAVVTASNSVNAVTETTTVFVEVPVAGLFILADSPVQPGQAVQFEAVLWAGTNVSYTWDFGDGSPPVTGSAEIVSHAYASPGQYTVMVTAFNHVSQETAVVQITVLTVVYAPIVMRP